MTLIEFKSLPDTSTPFTAENFNHNFEETRGIFKLLWENPDKGTYFSGDIELSSDDYDMLLVFYRPNSSYSPTKGELWFKGCDWRLMSQDSAGNLFYRQYTRNSDTSFTAGVPTNNGEAYTGTAGNNRNVPTYIYGIKNKFIS